MRRPRFSDLAALVGQFAGRGGDLDALAVEPVLGVLDVALVIADPHLQRVDLGFQRDHFDPLAVGDGRLARRGHARVWRGRPACRSARARSRAVALVLTEYSSSVARSWSFSAFSRASSA